MEKLDLKPKKNHKGDSRTCLTDLFHTYKHQAKSRKFIFELNKEQFKKYQDTLLEKALQLYDEAQSLETQD